MRNSRVQYHYKIQSFLYFISKYVLSHFLEYNYNMNLLNDDKELIPYKSFKQCLLITLSVALGTFGLSYNTYLLNGPLEYIRIWLKFNDSP